MAQTGPRRDDFFSRNSNLTLILLQANCAYNSESGAPERA
jgi:hypothetical protein